MSELSLISQHRSQPTPEITPATEETMRYALVITNDGSLITNTVHATRRERRDACVEVLKETCHYVRKQKVQDILLAFGGADPDAALGSITELYAEHGVDVYLEDQVVPEDPKNNLGLPLIYSLAMSEGGKSFSTVEHFATPDKRTDRLQQLLINLNAGLPEDRTNDEVLVARVQQTMRDLIGNSFRVQLADAPSPEQVS